MAVSDVRLFVVLMVIGLIVGPQPVLPERQLHRARRTVGQVADWYFSNGKDFDGVVEQ